jgi:hypothetical protein
MYTNIQSDDIVVFNERKYYVLTVFVENNKKYAFLNQVTDDEQNVTEVFFLAEVTAEGNLVAIDDEATLNALAPRIQSEVEKAFEDINDQI